MATIAEIYHTRWNEGSVPDGVDLADWMKQMGQDVVKMHNHGVPALTDISLDEWDILADDLGLQIGSPVHVEPLIDMVELVIEHNRRDGHVFGSPTEEAIFKLGIESAFHVFPNGEFEDVAQTYDDWKNDANL